MQYNCLSDYLIKEQYQNYNICSCVSIKSSTNKFTVMGIYIDDLNLVDVLLNEISITTLYLKKEFELKGLGKARFYIGVPVDH